ncbi:MAG TPA: sialidase family protein [Dermatophilaceae bacterium]
MSNIDPDPVEELFERERNQIVSQHGNDVHWQGIVRRARADRRSRFFGYVAGVAAAGLVIGGITYGAALHNSSVPLTAATNGGGAAIQTPRPVATGEQKPVPASFAAMSISNVGQGNIFVLGSSCRESTPHCAVLIGSTDNGQTWHQTSGIKAIGSVAMPTLGKDPSAGNGVSQVRFANARIGWIFGLDVQYTTDGGKTFRPYDHLGQFVTDVETDGTQVIVTSVDQCSNTVCKGTYHVARASITATGATAEVGTGATVRGLDDLQIVFDAKQPYVSPRWALPPTSGFEPQRVTAGGLEPVSRLGGACGSPSEQDLIATADPQGGLFAFCAAAGGGAAGSMGMAVFSSTDQGRSWTAVSSDALILVNPLVNPGSRFFAGANAKDLLAVSGGDPAIHGSMQVSHDGGRSWHSPGSPPPMPTNGWAWIGAPGGKTFYAISGDAVPAFWRSDDGGETWTMVGLTS